MKYFEKCNTTDQARKEYLKLAKKFHPDISKEVNAKEKFQDIQNQYEKKLRELLRAEGKSDLDIENLINSFNTPEFTGNLMDAVKKFSEDAEEMGIDIHKAPTPKEFGKVFNHVLKTLMGEIGTDEKKKLDKK